MRGDRKTLTTERKDIVTETKAERKGPGMEYGSGGVKAQICSEIQK